MLYAFIFGKMPYRDRFGLKYFLWPDTRLESTVSLSKVRTDDTGVIKLIERIIRTLKDYNNDELICCDVGAFIGVISLAMTKYLGKRGYVIAFEPSLKNFNRLRENIDFNRKTNIFPVHAAISDTLGKCRIANTDGEPGKERIVQPIDYCQDNKHEIVLKTTLDNFAACYGIKNLALLKIDAEGFDDKVLAGAAKFLERQAIDYIIVEFNDGTECSNNVLKILADYKYDVFFIVRNTEDIVANLSDYPLDKHKPPLNLVAVSHQARGKREIHR